MEKKDKEIVVDFYKSLDSILKKKTMTRNRLKKLSGVSLERYKVDGKDMREPNLSSLVKMADALDVSLDELCGRGVFATGRQLTAYECWRALDTIINNMDPVVRVPDIDAEGITLEFPHSNVTEILTSAERYEATYKSMKEFDSNAYPLSPNDAKEAYKKKKAFELQKSNAKYDAFLDSRYAEIEYEQDDEPYCPPDSPF